MLCSGCDSLVCNTGFSRNYHRTIPAKSGTDNISCKNLQPLRDLVEVGDGNAGLKGLLID